MDITVSADEADRTFPDLLRGVGEGKTYTVTEAGRPVARIAPVEAGDAVVAEDRPTADKEAAWRALMTRLGSQPAMNLPKFTRDEMHERD